MEELSLFNTTTKPQININSLDYNPADYDGWFKPWEITPVQKIGDYFVKRDDLCRVGAVRGGKVRTCLSLAVGAPGLITAGSRHSPQCAIVAAVAKYLGIPCRVHTPQGELGYVVQWAKDNGAEVVQHRAGYNSVIKKRAFDDSLISGWRLIPFGMECQEAVSQTKKQTINIPAQVRRIVIPVGSGMSFAGILAGAPVHLPVLGVAVGADPMARLKEYATCFPDPRIALVKSRHNYSEVVTASIGDIDLDPIYEAKCVEFLEPGDLFWIVGNRRIIV